MCVWQYRSAAADSVRNIKFIDVVLKQFDIFLVDLIPLTPQDNRTFSSDYVSFWSRESGIRF